MSMIKKQKCLRLSEKITGILKQIDKYNLGEELKLVEKEKLEQANDVIEDFLNSVKETDFFGILNLLMLLLINTLHASTVVNVPSSRTLIAAQLFFFKRLNEKIYEEVNKDEN